jgi:DUF4097 and DUF4098 domain-containing protein YvlB
MITITSAVAILAFVALAPAPQRAGATVPLEAADCSRFRSSFGTDEVATAVQHASVPMSAGRLDIDPGQNGGVRIQGGSAGGYSITACIAAGSEARADAQALVDAARIEISGNSVRVSGLGNIRHSSVHLIIEAPPGAQIDARTVNGPISIYDVDGSITARATNGPIGLVNVTGAVRALAANGPISVSGSGGNLDVETQNGPISVDLKGTQWAGELNGRAQNGPLSLKVADDFTSGLEISSSTRSPWNCRIAACRTDLNEGDQGSRSLRLGSGSVVVKLTTANGPVTLDNGR